MQHCTRSSYTRERCCERLKERTKYLNQTVIQNTNKIIILVKKIVYLNLKNTQFHLFAFIKHILEE